MWTGFCAEAMVDSWDLSRSALESILSRLPTPLPGYESLEPVKQLLHWCNCLLASPRLHEADAGKVQLKSAIDLTRPLTGRGPFPLCMS